MFDGGDGNLELKKKLLEEMAGFAQAGMAKDMRERFGKSAPEEAAPEMAEDPEIPGVGASADGEGDMPEEMASEGEEIDPEMLRALLASMKGG